MKRHYIWLISLLAITVFTTACNKNKKADEPYDPVKQAQIDEQLIKTYIADKNLTGVVKDDTSALYYKILEPGAGEREMALNDRMLITYKGTLLNGTVFDERQRESFNNARLEELIKGWQLGIRKIRKEGKILLLIPSELGYGNRNMGTIPARSVLVFEVTLHNYYF